MSSSWKRQASRIAFAAAFAVAAFLVIPRPAEAAGCPTTPVTEHGGKHWCYKHDVAKGNVHLWTPAGYTADTAVTVIYIHGLDTGKNGPDTCNKKRPYVDCIWDASDHGLVQQFAASGVNALFVAVEGPILSVTNEGVKWSALSSLLGSISDKGKLTPPANVTAIGHSAGMYTARSLWKDARVKHVVSVDWVDGSLESAVSSWYNQGGGRKLTLLGGSSGQQGIMDRMEDDLKCTRAASASTLTSAEIAVRCLYQRTSVGHMRPVFDKKFMPQAIKRSGVAAEGGGTTGPTTAPAITSSGVVSGTPLTDGPVAAPLLEIPIPGVELSNAVRTNGAITIPWLAQYVGGVYTFLLSIAGMLAAVMMVVGGFQYVTSGGDKGRLGAGKEKIVNALTGLVLAFSSYVILYSINPNLVEFDGLKVGGVQTEVFRIDEDHEPSADLYESASPPATVSVSNAGFADHAVAFCNCKRGQTSGCTKSCDDFCKGLPADSSKWPEDTPGFMPKAQTIVIRDYKLSDAFPGRAPDRVLVQGNGERAHPKVVEALYAAAKQAALDYPSNAYKISVSECWRSIQSQINKGCAGPVGGPFNGVSTNAPGGVAFPGGSNHGVGYACDLRLYDGSRNMFDYSNSNGDRPTKAQCYTVKREDSKRFDDIMFKVGWVRYAAEVWHYEFGSPAGGRCGPNAKGGPATCVFPPAKFCS